MDGTDYDLFMKAADGLDAELDGERQANQWESLDSPLLREAAGAAGSVLSDAVGSGVEAIGRLFSGEADPEFAQAVTSAETDLKTQQEQPSEPGVHQKAVASLMAIPTGAVQAGYETRDAFMGEPSEGEKSAERRAVEALDADLGQTTAVAGVTSSLSQFITGMIGAGKVLKTFSPTTRELLEGGSKAARVGYETARGALAGYFALDPHEERLSNLLQEYPGFQQPVFAFLAAHPEDSNSEGRLKNALEGVGMDLAAAGLFATALRAIRWARGGNSEVAQTVAAELATPEAVSQVQALEKPRVRVPAGSSVIVPEAAAVEKPRVRIKAGRGGEEVIPESPAVGVQDVTISPVRSEASDLPATVAVKGAQPGEITPEQMTTILRGTDFDLEAVAQAGSYEEAVAQGYKFSDGGNLPWQKMNTPEEVEHLIENAAQTLRPELDAMKGGDVLSDAKVDLMVRNAARYYNADPSAIIGDIVRSGEAAKDLVRNMEAGYLISNKMFMDAYDVVNKVRWGRLDDFAGDKSAAIAEAKRRLELAVHVFGQAESIKANVGRTMRRMRSEFQVDQMTLSKLQNLGDEDFMELIRSTGGDPRKMRELAKPAFLKRVLDEVQFSMRNGLLWLYPTHLINITGNIYMQVARPLEKSVGSLLMGGKGRAIRQQATKEFYYTAASLTDGFKAGAEAFMKGDSLLAPHMTDYLDTNGASQTAHRALAIPTFRPVRDFNDVWANLHLASLYRNTTGLPTRLLGGQDEFFKTIRYRAVVQARSAATGESMGLSGSQLRDFIEDRLARSFDADGRAIDREALYEAQTATFNQELIPGTLGASIRNFRGRHPWVGLVLPFVKTPINVLRYAHKYTPVLNLAQQEYRQALRGVMGPEAQAQAIGQMALGSLFAGSALMMAASGRITGGGPKDGQLRQQLISTGWKPYSVMVRGEDGSTTYVPYGRLDPPGMVMGIVADLHHLYAVDPENRDYTDLAQAVTIALAKNFGEKTFLLNMNQLIDALSDPENKMEKFLGNMGASVVPMSAALRGYVNPDPYLRDARDFLDRVLKDVPGLSEHIPPRRTVFGEPITRNIGLTSVSRPDIVDEEHNRIMVDTGVGIGAPNPNHRGVDLRDVTLGDGRNAYDVYQEYASTGGGVPLRDALKRLIESPSYRELPDGDTQTKGTRINALQGVVQEYRENAYRRLVGEHPEVHALTMRRQVEAAAKYKDNKEGKGAGDRLRESLGFQE